VRILSGIVILFLTVTTEGARMKNKTILIGLFLLFFIVSLRSEITTHESIAALADYIAKEQHDRNDIVVICDLDNTLIHPKTEVGSDQWIEHEAQMLAAAQGVSLAQAYQAILPLYYKIQHRIDLQLTEALIPELIADLKKDGITVIGLTARHNPIVDRTLEQLALLDIEFSDLVDRSMDIEASYYPALYKKGTIFCGNNNKGEVLFKFFALLGMSPKKLYFIDDKKHHLLTVEKIALERGIACVCIHYTGCADRVENFNSEQARIEMMLLDAQ
jgi:phosphoglycolate phosphatase-like HAD superfamily hydrolase